MQRIHAFIIATPRGQATEPAHSTGPRQRTQPAWVPRGSGGGRYRAAPIGLGRALAGTTPVVANRQGQAGRTACGAHEIKEVLRLWLRGEGVRSVARLARVVDRKTVRRHVAAARSRGLDQAGVRGHLCDELLSRVAERVHRTTRCRPAECSPPRRRPGCCSPRCCPTTCRSTPARRCTATITSRSPRRCIRCRAA